eukprot:8467246-Pyramimonas_sp.AAC.1
MVDRIRVAGERLTSGGRLVQQAGELLGAGITLANTRKRQTPRTRLIFRGPVGKEGGIAFRNDKGEEPNHTPDGKLYLGGKAIIEIGEMLSGLPPLEEAACLAELKTVGGAMFDASGFFIPILREPLCDAADALEMLAESCLDRDNMATAGERFVDFACKMSQYGDGMLFQPAPYPEVRHWSRTCWRVGEMLISAAAELTRAGNALTGEDYEVCPI